MLFGYPAEAAQENWLHEAVVSAVLKIHARVDAGMRLPRWPEILPANVRERLKRREKLKKLLARYRKAIASVSGKERTAIKEAVLAQNRIESLLSGSSDCLTAKELPQAVQVAASALFYYSFDALGGLGIRDRQYKVIYNNLSNPVCPFCGIEYFKNPNGPREDLDHYLSRSRYPFAAANLWNLAPMGGDCNRIKLDKDILRTGSGNSRRAAFNPYRTEGVKIDLRNSVPFEGAKNGAVLLPRWMIEFVPNSDEVETWDAVFEIRRRYSEDILNRCYRNWVSSFGTWMRKQHPNAKTISAREIRAGLDRYLEEVSIMPNSGYEVLLEPVFAWMQHAATAKLVEWLRDIVPPPAA